MQNSGRQNHDAQGRLVIGTTIEGKELRHKSEREEENLLDRYNGLLEEFEDL